MPAPGAGDGAMRWIDLVIPGRCEASNPESRDSGSGANAPSRNDGQHPLLTTKKITESNIHALCRWFHRRGAEEKARSLCSHVEKSRQALARIWRAGLPRM